MRRPLSFSLGFLLCMATLFIGCSGQTEKDSQHVQRKGSSYEPPKRVNREGPVKSAKTPKEALVLMATAFSGPDLEQLLAVVKVDQQDENALKDFVAFIGAGLDFRDAFIREYGKDGWETFQDPKQAPKNDGNANLNLNVGEEAIAKAKNANVTINGNRATAIAAGETKPAKLVRENDKWLVDLKGMIPIQEARKMATMATIIRRYQKAIGHGNISGEDIDAELGRAILKQLKGVNLPKPHRFDIDSIR